MSDATLIKNEIMKYANLDFNLLNEKEKMELHKELERIILLQDELGFFPIVIDEYMPGDAIKKGIVSDQEFENQFIIWKGGKNSKDAIRYIFRKIHKYLDVSNEINIDTSEVHIEHIMPEEASQWNVSEDIHDAYLWRLGNLMLLSGAFNRSISNKPFDQKKDVYKTSKIEPNNNVYYNDEWTYNEIEYRQNELSKHALKIWKIN